MSEPLTWNQIRGNVKSIQRMLALSRAEKNEFKNYEKNKSRSGKGVINEWLMLILELTSLDYQLRKKFSLLSYEGLLDGNDLRSKLKKLPKK